MGLRNILSILFLSLVVAMSAPPQGVAGSKAAFSFLVFGDSRLPGYIPFGAGQRVQLRDLLQKVAQYAYPGIKMPKVRIIFQPLTGDLERIIIPGLKKGPVRTVFYRQGWPVRIVDCLGTRCRTAMRKAGGDWVFRRIIAALKQGVQGSGRGPTFVLHTGDMVYNGLLGRSLAESPYWQDFHDRFLQWLPPGGPGHLPGRFWPAPGNHETWGDENLVGLMTTIPYLKRLGFSVHRRVYKFDHQGCRFIFLDTGDYDPRRPSWWLSRHPDYKGQMSILRRWLQEASDKGLRRVFITFHNPVFCRAGFALPKGQNPHALIKSFVPRLDLTVFTGHVHTTEMYLVDGVRYLVLGAGGGEQDLQARPAPPNYPPELYWQGRPRVEEYNYLLVKVTKGRVRMWINRFRPGSRRPFQQVELLKMNY